MQLDRHKRSDQCSGLTDFAFWRHNWIDLKPIGETKHVTCTTCEAELQQDWYQQKYETSHKSKSTPVTLYFEKHI